MAQPLKIAQGLHLKQAATLVMTPQLQQSLKMLQLSSLELAEFIDMQLEKNPLLQKEDGEFTEETSEKEEAPEEDASLDLGEEADWDQEEHSLHFKEAKHRERTYQEDDSEMESRATKEKTLREHIMDQAILDFKLPENRAIAMHLVDLLENTGYITADLTALSHQLGVPFAAVEAVLHRLQKCDPAGVFARNLAECLTLQLKEKNRFDPAMEKLVKSLDLLANGEIERLQKLCGVNHEDMLQMCAEIRALNPKPGEKFEPSRAETLIPDIFVRRKHGAWHIELNNETLPKLLVNRHYYSEVKKRTKSEQEKKFLSEQWSDANWLIKTLNQRANTVLKVATEIVTQQEAFFEKGLAHLKPMTMKSIADLIGMHESTVGRVSSNKYLATPRGTYELKFFFSSGVHGGEGEDISSHAIKQAIKDLIDKEQTTAILSDDKIAEILQSRQMEVARRTVAKYREAMNIPPSSQRKRQKKTFG